MNIQDTRRSRLANLIKEKYGTQANFSELTGENASEISTLIKEGSTKSFGEKKARKIENLCGLPKGWLDEGHDDFPTPTADDYEIIPQLDLEASCGHGKFNDYVVVKGGLSFKRETLRAWGITPKNGRVIYADGQSMEPTIGHGRVVLIKTDDTAPQDGRVYLICDGDSAMLLKRLVREFDPASGAMVWKMRSDNPDKRQYADKPLPDHSAATVVGRAVWYDGVL